MDDDAARDWSAFSREAVATMQARNDAWMARFGLDGSSYEVALDEACLRFRKARSEVLADLCVVGTVSHAEGVFVWAWAHDSFPALAVAELADVIRFGQEHDLALLTEPGFPGDRSDGLECASIAGFVQQAEGVFVDYLEGMDVFFTLTNFRERPLGSVAADVGSGRDRPDADHPLTGPRGDE